MGFLDSGLKFPKDHIFSSTPAKGEIGVDEKGNPIGHKLRGVSENWSKSQLGLAVGGTVLAAGIGGAVVGDVIQRTEAQNQHDLNAATYGGNGGYGGFGY